MPIFPFSVRKMQRKLFEGDHRTPPSSEIFSDPEAVFLRSVSGSQMDGEHKKAQISYKIRLYRKQNTI